MATERLPKVRALEARLGLTFGLIAPRVGHHTYWDAAQGVWEISAGVWGCSTAGHGGIWLAPERIEELPQAVLDYMATHQRGYAEGPQWYEEDCGWAIPFAFLPRQGLVERVNKARADECLARIREAPSVVRSVYPELARLLDVPAPAPVVAEAAEDVAG